MISHGIDVLEIDVPRCVLNYGVTCSAAIGVTGTDKCTNKPGDCQVPIEFDSEVQVLRFVSNSETLLAAQIQAIPSLLSSEVSPQIIRPGESLGKRERATFYLKDHPHNGYGFDPYIEDRTYNSFKQGTFLGKLIAGWPNMVGYPVRRYVGQYTPGSSDPLADLTVAHYVVDKVDRGAGGLSISALDALTFTDDKKALAPVPSNGVLVADLPVGLTPFTLSPTGIGDEYALSGYGSIDKEYISFTRVGDVITPTGRGLFESGEKEHTLGSTFQQAAVFEGNISEILQQLLAFTNTPFDYYDIANWDAEAAAHAPDILVAHIASPTGVDSLINKLMVEKALNIFTDIENKLIHMNALVPIVPIKSYTESNAYNIGPSLDNSARVDTVFMRYGRINPVEKFDEPKNYSGALLQLDDNPFAAILQNTPAIREINSIFIPANLRNSAENTADIILNRYNRLLRQATASTIPELGLPLGEVVGFTCDFFQDSLGRTIGNIPMQIVSVKKDSDKHTMTLVEYNFGNFTPSTDHTIYIEADVLNLDFRALHDTLYAPAVAGDSILFVISAGVKIGYGTNTGWPTGVEVIIEFTGDARIQGAGGEGGYGIAGGGGASGHGATGGGTAFYTRSPVTLRNCHVWGGGGGGGEGNPSSGTTWGGGGQGYPPGLGGTSAGNATSESPGDSGSTGSSSSGADGGAAGMPGGSAFGVGGAAGAAIDGISYCTIEGTSDILGPQIN